MGGTVGEYDAQPPERFSWKSSVDTPIYEDKCIVKELRSGELPLINFEKVALGLQLLKVIVMVRKIIFENKRSRLSSAN